MSSGHYLVYKHKQGDTLDFPAVAQIDDENADLTGWTGKCQVRTPSGVLIEELTFEWLDASEGAMRIYSDNLTGDWPVGEALMDIQFTTGEGAIISSPTVTLDIVGDVTQ